MSKVQTIPAQPRTKPGTQIARRTRREGFLPGVVYGHKKDTVSVAVPATEFIQMLRKGQHLFELQMSDHTETVLVKEVQYNYLGTDPIHVDFSRVDLNERVKVAVPLVLRGTAAGVAAGGVLQQILMELQIECVVTDIPEQIRANIAGLELNQSLHAREIALPQGAKLVTDAETVVAVVSEVKEEEAAAAVPGAEAAATEPEVITKGKVEEEGEEGAAGGEAAKKA